MSPPFFNFTRLPTGHESWALHAFLAEQLQATPAGAGATTAPNVGSPPPPLPHEFQHYENIPAFVVVRLGEEIPNHLAPLPWEQWTMNHIFRVLRHRAPRSMPFYGVVHSHHWVRFYREKTTTTTGQSPGTTGTNMGKDTVYPLAVNHVHTLHWHGDEQLIAEFVEAVRSRRHRRLRRRRGAPELSRAFDGVPAPRARRVPFHEDQIEWVRGEDRGQRGDEMEGVEAEEEKVSDELPHHSPSPSSSQGTEDMGMDNDMSDSLSSSVEPAPFSDGNDRSSWTLGHSEEPPVFHKREPSRKKRSCGA
ncbi:uncharacterized protein BO95DRAFT_141208 [Aspergillus brunneoviolaceus CBS 621.78]|uniref:Uncharacterized protein n=1 Tax=Aspergillus brunneoviolaceus CBS 621.78 TaxID=1450534 RepID=A0ACD1G899_9EURO|nr:hypothetical protein BO95DRAFT_141208 [Aspergillus brunneoviolaceus CBS 621.78]RAH45437.1 hypothetical protein BO95DRAFT_141208 [Aspergillus brunneoviolaceus CBS 621.78]